MSFFTRLLICGISFFLLYPCSIIAQVNSKNVEKNISSRAKALPEPKQEFHGKITIVRDLHDQSVCEGRAIRFVIGIQGSSTETPKFQWQQSTNGGRTWINIKGANQPYYDGIQNVTRQLHGTLIRVIIKAGQQTITSKVAGIFIQHLLDLNLNISEQVTVEGGYVQFESKFDLTKLPEKTYFQWQITRYGTALWEDMPGENRTFLEMFNVSMRENGSQLRLLAYGADLCDTMKSKPALLSVLKKPQVSVTPGRSSFCGGGSATFSVLMEGASGLEKIQWQISKNEGLSYENIPSANGLFHLLPEITPEMTGHRYRAKLELPGGVRMVTHEAIVTVYGAISFAEKPKSQSVCYGDEAVFNIKANYKGNKPNYQWQIDSSGIGDFKNIEGADEEEYRISTDNKQINDWKFRALVTVGDCNSIELSPVTLHVLNSLRFTLQPSDCTLQMEEDDAFFFANFDGKDKDYSITWQWSANDGATWQSLPNSSSKKLVLPRVHKETAHYKYRMRVLNKMCGRIFYSNTAQVVFKT